MLNFIEDADGKLFRFWNPPQTLPTRAMSIIDSGDGDLLHGHASGRPETYLLFDGASDGRSIIDGVLLGDIPTGVSKIITYRAKVNTKEFFNFGTNNLINSALVYNSGISISDTATVVVVKRSVAGAATDINTGIVSDFFGSLLLPLGLAALLLFIFKSQLLGFDKWATVRKEETNGFRAQRKLNSLIKKRK